MRVTNGLRRMLQIVLCAIGCLAACVPFRPAAAADIVGPAIVGRDGALLIHGRWIHLAGIYVPPTNFICRGFERPSVCNSRASLALDFHIGSHQVHCQSLGAYDDGSLAAACYLQDSLARPGDDLAAWLVAQGWALALPDAPFAYMALERIARAQHLGVWGFTVDSFE